MTLALEIGWGTTLAIKTLVVLAIIPLGALILGYTFLLKMMSHMQSRLGPMEAGPYGQLQLIDPTAASATEVLYNWFMQVPEWREKMTADMATLPPLGVAWRALRTIFRKAWRSFSPA